MDQTPKSLFKVSRDFKGLDLHFLCCIQWFAINLEQKVQATKNENEFSEMSKLYLILETHRKWQFAVEFNWFNFICLMQPIPTICRISCPKLFHKNRLINLKKCLSKNSINGYIIIISKYLCTIYSMYSTIQCLPRNYSKGISERV